MHGIISTYSRPRVACALHRKRGRPVILDRRVNPHQESLMKLVRTIFVALAVLLPPSWTIAKAADAPAGDTDSGKKEKKSKKAKKGDDADKKADDKAAK